MNRVAAIFHCAIITHVATCMSGCGHVDRRIETYLENCATAHEIGFPMTVNAPVIHIVRPGDAIPPMSVATGAWTVYKFVELRSTMSAFRLLPALLDDYGLVSNDVKNYDFAMDISVRVDTGESMPSECWSGRIENEDCVSKPGPRRAGGWVWSDRGMYQTQSRLSWPTRRDIVVSIKLGEVRLGEVDPHNIVLYPDVFYYPPSPTHVWVDPSV